MAEDIYKAQVEASAKLIVTIETDPHPCLLVDAEALMRDDNDVRYWRLYEASNGQVCGLERYAEAPQPRVLWRGDLNDLLHAVNGTPIMSVLLDVAVAPDDPDAHKIRVAVIEDTETPGVSHVTRVRCDHCKQESEVINRWDWWSLRITGPGMPLGGTDSYDLCSERCLSAWLGSRFGLTVDTRPVQGDTENEERSDG